MKKMALPSFKYHPDPLSTGSVVKSRTECVCCGQVRGFIYVGPVYAEEEYDENICPWCIADGSAHEKFDAEFADPDGIGNYGQWGKVAKRVIEEVAYRTPCFLSWQAERWWTHCRDAAQFVGSVGRKELMALGPQAVAAIRESAGLPEGPGWNSLLAALRKNGSPRAYLFRCVKCGQFGGYHDYD
jgi:uncharacterized protein CbrC (UPF0167 family)